LKSKKKKIFDEYRDEEEKRFLELQRKQNLSDEELQRKREEHRRNLEENFIKAEENASIRRQAQIESLQMEQQAYQLKVEQDRLNREEMRRKDMEEWEKKTSTRKINR